MLYCIAVDDEPLALDLLEDNIKKIPFLHLVAKCGDAFEATKILQENNVDLVFIDIQMPGLTGLQFIQSLAQKPMIILITAYKQFALDSYELNVIDYLVKPVALERFMKACNKAKELYELKTPSRASQMMDTAEFFFQQVDYSQVKIIFKDITWIEGLRDYIKIHLKSTHNPLVIRSSIKAIEAELPKSTFVRIHKSYIVSINSLTSVRKNSVFLEKVELPVGDTYREVIMRITGKNPSR